jgi:hypothetical protein
MTDAAMAAVITPGVRHGQGLQDAADRLARLWPLEQVEVIARWRVSEKCERIALLRLRQCQREKEGPEIPIVMEDALAVGGRG